MHLTTYFAYGSNLDPDRMRHRCPSATPLGSARLDGWRLRIGRRGVATIQRAASESTWGGLWDIATGEIKDLDAAEGVCIGLYEPIQVEVLTGSGLRRARVYIEPFDGPGAPRPGYLRHLVVGAEYFDLPSKHREHIAALAG
jgi:hypothetical protein